MLQSLAARGSTREVRHQHCFDVDRGSLLEMAEACDVPTRWSRRTGVCHTCSTPLLSGAVRYSLAPPTAPDAGQVLLCSTRPDTDVILDL